MTRTAAALALVLSAGAASAQSCFIDLDTFQGAGYGEPSMGCPGPAGVYPSAAWSYLTASSPTTSPVYGLMGNQTLATITRATNGVFASFNNPNTTGDFQSLFDDFQENPGGPLVYTFNNLEPGLYAIYTSAVDPSNANNRCTVTVANPVAYCQASQVVGGPLTQFNTIRTHVRAGVTHALHIKQVYAGTPLTITITDGVNSSAVCNGIQLVKLGESRLRIYVDSGATAGLNNGGSWTNAFTDLQFALDAAHAAGGGNCEIWVASGMYRPTQGTDRTATFDIPDQLRILGGFDGTETDLSERGDPLFTPTYLSGSIGASTATDDCYTVITLENVGSNTLVDGFYIARGYNNGGPYSGRGGGMVIDYGISPTIRNCSFTTNTASLGGGALYLKNATTRIINCTFFNSDVYNGAGGAIESVGPINTTLTLHNCRFLGNHALGDGGAIHTNFVHADIANCLFSGNSTDNEGGAIKSAGDDQGLSIVNSTFSMNTAGDFSGGIYVSGGMDVQMHNSILWGNTGGMPGTIQGQQVTVIANSGSTLTASYNTLQGNSPNPLFLNAAGNDGVPGNFDDNCRVQQGSPCIDAADASKVPDDIGDIDDDGNTFEAIPVDQDGGPRRVEILSIANTGMGGLPPIDRGCYEFQLSAWCPANCDNSERPPVLNVSDFICFQTKYAAGDPYANCDGSTIVPILNVSDFICFQQKYAAGCP
jgi:predicted outer membrane repeat protein